MPQFIVQFTETIHNEISIEAENVDGAKRKIRSLDYCPDDCEQIGMSSVDIDSVELSK